MMRATFCSPDFRVFREGDRFFMTSIDLNAIYDAPTVCRVCADLLSASSGLLRLYALTEARVTAGTFWCLAPGHDHCMAVMYSGPITVRGTDDAVRARSLGITDSAGRSLGTRILEGARRHPPMVRALQILEARDEQWARIYKLLEIVKADVGGEGGIVARGWAESKKKIELLRWTANCNRHEARRTDPPPMPMPFDEAWLLIRTIVMRWIESAADEDR